MEEWIVNRLERFKRIFPESKVSEIELEWISEVLESAWDRGHYQGRKEAFELMSQYAKNQNE